MTSVQRGELCCVVVVVVVAVFTLTCVCKAKERKLVGRAIGGATCLLRGWLHWRRLGGGAGTGTGTGTVDTYIVPVHTYIHTGNKSTLTWQ